MATTAAIRGSIPAPKAEKELRGLMGLLTRIIDQLRGNILANLFFFVALVIGFLHGWLKFKYRYAITTFAYDIPMVIALVLVMIGMKRKDALFPECRVSTALKLLVGCAILYTVLPFDVPWLVRISSLRGWCFAPLMMLLGYHLVRSVRQMEVFIWLVILLGTATAIYGIFFQTEAEVRALMLLDPELEMKLRGSFYSTSTGSAFRRYSTYVTSAVFGSVMAICTTFSVSRMLVPGISWFQRAILLVCSAACSYSVLLTGSRTSLLMLGLGLLLTTIFCRGLARFMFVPALLFAAVFAGVQLTEGNAGERFSTLLDFTTVAGRMNIVLSPAMSALMDAPLGHGIGRSGHGVPFLFYSLYRDFTPMGVDGDIGRLVVDMGLVGLVVYIVMLYSGLSDSIRWMWRLRDSNLGIIASPTGTLFILGLIQVFTGSPYLGIPAGMLLWILFGGLRRVVEEYERLAAVEGEAVEDLPQFVSFIKRKRMISMFPDGARQLNLTNRAEPGSEKARFVSVSAAPRQETAAANRPTSKVRFLFRREPRIRK